LIVRSGAGTPPISQLLATGGVLFLLQSAAIVKFGIDFRNLGIGLLGFLFAAIAPRARRRM